MPSMAVLYCPDLNQRSYQQWKEENIAPRVIFEILSPSSRAQQVLARQVFYSQCGVQEI